MAIIGGIAAFFNALIACLTYPPWVAGVTLILLVAGIVEEVEPTGPEEQPRIDADKKWDIHCYSVRTWEQVITMGINSRVVY